MFRFPAATSTTFAFVLPPRPNRLYHLDYLKRERLRAYVHRHGLYRAAKMLDLSRLVIAALVADFGVRKASFQLAQRAMKKVRW